MAVDVNTLAVKVHTEGAEAATAKLRELGREGAATERSLKGTTGASKDLGSQMLKLVGILTAVYIGYRKLSEIIGIGMRVETMGTAMQVVAKNAGLSAEALKYFSEEVKSSGITTMETYSNVTKAMLMGLDMNKMKELATRARDIAVIQGLNTSEAFARIMSGIQSQSIEVFRTMGVMVRPMKTVFEEYALSVGKTAKQLTEVDRKNAVLNETLRATERYAGAAAAADEEVGKQLASMQRYAEEAYLALWELFAPGMRAGVAGLTDAFKELRAWAETNKDQLRELGEQLGQTITWMGQAALDTTKFAAANADLLKTLLELYILTKLMIWITGVGVALQALYIRLSMATGGFALLSTAQTVFIVDSAGVATACTTMSASLQTLQLSAAGAAGAIISVFAAWGYSAYKWQKDMREHPEDYGIGPESALDVAPGVWTGAGTRAKKRGEAEWEGAYMQEGLNVDQVKFLRELDATKYIRQATEAMNKAREQAEKDMKGTLEKTTKGKGGAGKDTAESFQNLMRQLEQTEAQATDDTFRQIDLWSKKMEDNIRKLAKTEEEVAEGMEKLGEARVAKERKVEEDFVEWYNSQMGYTTDRQIAEDKKKLDSVKGRIALEQKALEVQRMHNEERERKASTERLTMLKSYIDSMAGLTDNISDQLELKEMSLGMEQRMAAYRLEDWFVGKKLTETEKDNYRILLQQVQALQRYQVEKEKAIKLGTLEGWAIQRSEEAKSRGGWAGFMQGAESFMYDSLSEGIKGVLAHDKNTLKRIGQTMFEGFVGELLKRSTRKVFDQLAEWMVPDRRDLRRMNREMQRGGGGGGGIGGGIGGGAGEGLGEAASGLLQVSDAFNLNSIQFGLAAGGLLLSGIGIATNSQALVYAGMVLQTVAMLIQMYQMLSATQSAAVLTAAGSTLMVAGTSLISAAIALGATSFLPWHEGGLVTAHTGYLAHDERIIKVQTGERVLSREDTKKYDAEKTTTSSSVSNRININIDARGAQKGINWKKVAKNDIAPEIAKLIKVRRLKVG